MAGVRTLVRLFWENLLAWFIFNFQSFFVYNLCFLFGCFWIRFFVAVFVVSRILFLYSLG